MQAIGAFEASEPRRQRSLRHDPAPGADDPHADAAAQARHLLANASGANDTHRLPFEQDRSVGSMIESMALLIAGRLGEPARRVNGTGEGVLRRVAGVARV